MNLIESAIASLAPEWALSRAQARRALDIISHARGYDGAQIGRRTANWKAPGASANVTIEAALATLRNRSREMTRNDPYAKRAIDGLVSKSVGVGIMARTEKSVQKSWKQFCEVCDHDDWFDFYGLQNMAARTAYESGEVLIRRVRVRGDFGLKLQVLEPDYIDTGKFGAQDNGNFVISGVEVDRGGRRQALWLFDNHPGEVGYLTKSYTSRRVPYGDLIHFYKQDRPGQLRGVPTLAVAMMKARDLADADDAELVTRKIQACFSAFVSGGTGRTLGELTTDASRVPREETLSPGTIQYLEQGESVSFGTPRSTSDSEFYKRHLRAIAVGTGVTYELLTGDLSNVNYSSIRAGMIDFREMVETWRWVHFIPLVCRRVYRWFEESAYTAGRIRSTGYDIDWTPPQWPMVDAQKEIGADTDEVLAGLSSWSEKIRERGRIPEEVLAEIAAEREKFADLDLVFTSTTAAKAPAAQPDTTDDEKAQPSEKPGDAKAGNRQAPQIHVHNTFPEGAVRVDVAPASVSAPVTVNLPPRGEVKREFKYNEQGDLIESREVDLPEAGQ